MKTSPARSRSTPYGKSAPPAVTVVAKIAPSAMNAPAKTERRKTSSDAMPAFATPTVSALRATAAGASASSPVGVKGASLTASSVAPAPDGASISRQREAAEIDAVGPKTLPSSGVTEQRTDLPATAAPWRRTSESAALVTERTSRPPTVQRYR